MVVKTLVKSSAYHDSVSLMLIARELAETEGVEDAAVVMGTDANKSILSAAGLLSQQAINATANDLVIAIRAGSQVLAEELMFKAEEMLKRKVQMEGGDAFRPVSIRGAVNANPGANIAVISVAGKYAADEAWEALTRGLHVLLFSDNVSLKDEVALKRYARDHGLLLMGPGAGTAIINNVALGFANVVPSGPIGIVSAAGTGLQEVSSLITRHGAGITQGIGVGGRDLSLEVGGMMMLEALKALQNDPATEVIVLISKPPAQAVAAKILEQVGLGSKPTVICFLGGDPGEIARTPGAIPAMDLQEASLLAIQAQGSDQVSVDTILELQTRHLEEIAGNLRANYGKEAPFLRGLFSGGTLCYEAQLIWKDLLDAPIYSNAPLPGGQLLSDSTQSQGHSAIDLGEEEFTIGRPHPMIDNDLRIRRLHQEASDPQVGLILLDVVLGFGAHPDPVSELGPGITKALKLAKGEGRDLIVIASVTGTTGDPQGLSAQIAALEEVGVIVCESNSAAAKLVGMIVK